MEDWQKRAIERDTASQQVPEWMRKAMERDSVSADIFGDAGPQASQIDNSDDAPALVRMEVGSLEKPEDRLAALRKHYPDAKPYGDGNFIFSDEQGKTRLYNTESWFPGLGDFASIMPEIGETVGGGVGGLLGGVGGGVAGTAVPVVGTAAGAVTGAIGGAGVGSAAGREGTMWAMNKIFGNEDTRTGKEQLVDMAQTAALGAAGEGVGRLVLAPAAKALNKNFNPFSGAYKQSLIGTPDAKAAQRLEDWRGIGVEPTAGLITGNEKTALLEHALKPMRNGGQIAAKQDEAFQAQANEFNRIIGSMSPTTATPAGSGELIRNATKLAKQSAKDESDRLYSIMESKVTSPGLTDNTQSFLASLIDEKAAMNHEELFSQGALIDGVIERASKIIQSAQEGKLSAKQLKEARSRVGAAAKDVDDPFVKNKLNRMYAALETDMEKTAEVSGPEALEAFRKANDHYRDNYASPVTGFGKAQKRPDGLDNGGEAYNILSKNADEVFQYAMGDAKKGGNRVAQVRRIVERSEGGKQAWNQVAAGFTERLGRASINGEDAFEPTLFLNNWKKNVSPEVKNAIFTGTEGAQYRKDLDRLAEIGGYWKDYSKKANHSNTENHRQIKDSLDPLSRNNLISIALGTGASLASGGAAATGAIAGAVAKRAMGSATSSLRAGSQAKLLQNPQTVAWLANIGRGQMERGGLKSYVKKLAKIGASTSDNALAAAINEYLKIAQYSEDDR
ncbi:hypothetical protein [Rhizobium sp. Root482]|uniref:hypothetical protein n=1 Tax=Rhizobium sp. Root482 TaxID=1736543 RepID=UPI0006FB8909|nr:hypothetical protein [Rhizobium sp. Root482]KQY14433.1 hypothetical protein ASD31_09200 [Rhizobium sp. Root482]